MAGKTNSNNVWAHLDAIYGILRTIRNEASTWATNAENNAKAYTRSYAAPKSHSHNYASATHTHKVYTAEKKLC